MAEIFKPEVRDVGGSNLTAYTPPTVDYGSSIAAIGQIFKAAVDTKEVKGPTEAERKSEALRNVSANMLKIDQIEDPTRKAVAFKSLQQNAYREYPMYVEDLNKFFGEVSGEIYPTTGVSLDDINKQNRLKWAQETPEGKLAAQQAMLSSPDDIEQQEIMLASAYFASQKIDSDIAMAKKQNEGNKDLFEIQTRPMLQSEVDNSFQSMFKKFNIETILKAGESPSLALIDAVKAERLAVLGAVTNRINKNGIDPTAVKPETFMSEFDSLISMLEANSTILDREMKNRTDQEWNTKLAGSPFMIKAWASGKVDSQTFNWWLVNGGGEEAFMKLVNDGVGPAAGDTSPESMAPALSDGSPTDSANEFARRYESVFSREALVKTFNANPSWGTIVDAGLKTVQNYKLEGESPEFTEASHRAITSMFMVSLPEIDKGLQSVKARNIKKLLSDKTFLIAESMSKEMPEKGMGLYNVINTYSNTSAQVLVAAFKNQMETIKDTEYVPFNLKVDEFGNIELVVNEVAARLDPTLKKAMGAYRYTTRSKGTRATETLAIEQAPTITDPKKILSNYVSLFGSNDTQILDIIDSLSVIAKTSKKIPDNVKQGRDALAYISQSFK